MMGKPFRSLTLRVHEPAHDGSQNEHANNKMNWKKTVVLAGRISCPDMTNPASQFILDGFRPEEIGDFLNRNGIAVRAGHHCAQPILRRFGLESTVRASLGVYNNCEDIDALTAALWNLKQGRGTGLQ